MNCCNCGKDTNSVTQTIYGMFGYCVYCEIKNGILTDEFIETQYLKECNLCHRNIYKNEKFYCTFIHGKDCIVDIPRSEIINLFESFKCPCKRPMD